ncbi:MAG TPA: hypothetical protein VKD72_03120 [Gemmataceae bacterium]|nr:hypothetical protein [Gemmataceae bacterium]
MMSLRRAVRFALAASLLAGITAARDVSLTAEQPAAEQAAPAAKQTPAPQPAPAAQPPAAASKAGQEVTPDQMHDVPLEGLTEDQKALVFSILSDNRCDCGCGMTLAGCRTKDTTCKRSLYLANQVLDLVKQGKGRDAIVAAVLSPPSKYVQFNLPTGESPSVGPADAKVTILYYLDHQ